MKMDFRNGLQCGFVLLLSALISAFTSACGHKRSPEQVFEAATVGCYDEAIPGQFSARFFDGRLEKIKAESKDAFIRGYLTEHLDEIQFAEHDFYVHASPTDLGLVQATATTTTYADNWGVRTVAADKIWQAGYRGAGVIVAVIDTGADVTHPQLRNQIALNAGEVGLDNLGRNKANNGIDDDGNGFVDDAFGYDFVNNRGLTSDLSIHGTHVSGIIAAQHNDTVSAGGAYVEGMAPAAKILPLAFLDANGSGSMNDGVRAIGYAVARGARVINASWGGAGCSRAMREAITDLSAKNVVFVAAAGNESLNIDRDFMYPASLNLPSMITVGATGDHDHMAEYSNYGSSFVHLFAPGSAIISTYPGGEMIALSGTSMATPMVSGAVALLLSAYPSATVSQIRQALELASTKRSEYLNASKGRMNLTDALNQLRQLLGQ